MRAVILILLGAAFAAPNNCLCQPDTLWTRAYGGAGSPLQVIRASNGGFAVGTSGASGRYERLGTEFKVVKLDTLGDIEWWRYMVGRDSTERPRGGGAWTIAQVYDGGFVLGGTIANLAAVARVGSDGDSLWLRLYSRAEFNYSLGEMECCIAPDSNIVTATDENIVKLSIENGDIIWRSVIEHDVFNIEPVGDVGYLVAGYTGFWDNTYVAMIDPEGEVIWEREYEVEESEVCNGITPAGGGGWCLSVSSRFGNGNDDSYPKFMRIDEDGDIIWQRIYDDFGLGYGTAEILETPDGCFVGVGVDLQRRYFAMRTDFAGEVLWQAQYGGFEWGGENRDIYGDAYSVLLMEDGGYAIGGFSNRGCYLVRTEPDPVVLPFELEVLEERHDFGDVAVDSLVTWELPLHNFGRRYVFIDSVAFEGDTSSFSSDLELPLRIDPTDTVFVPVSFRPSADTTYEATFTFFFGDTQSVEVTLIGNGAPNAVIDDNRNGYPSQLSFSAYPNPFNSSTTIRFELPVRSKVMLKVIDIYGREVMTLIEQTVFPPGDQSLVFEGNYLPAGIFFLRMEAGKFVKTQKMTLVK